MKLNLPNNLSGLGFELPMQMYEADTQFYHDYFRSYRTSQYQRDDAEVAVPVTPSEVVLAPDYSERMTVQDMVAAQDAAAPAEPSPAAAEGFDALKLITLAVVVASKVL